MFCALEGMTAGSTVVYVLIRVRTRGPQTPVPGTGSGARLLHEKGRPRVGAFYTRVDTLTTSRAALGP